MSINSALQSMLASQSSGGGEQGFGFLGILRDIQFAPILDLNMSPLGKPMAGSIIASFIAGGVVNKKLNSKFLNAIRQAVEQISQMNHQQLEQLAQTMKSTGNISGLSPELAGMMRASGISLDH